MPTTELYRVGSRYAMHNLARLAAETARKYTLRARRDPSRDGASPDGLPPYQFCALVVRSTLDGGDYTPHTSAA